jgi:hypothetical protein
MKPKIILTFLIAIIIPQIAGAIGSIFSFSSIPTWYTTLVKSDSFKVRGHFRLQPFGSTKAQRKLIWINEFMKNGYTREAKKLSTV